MCCGYKYQTKWSIDFGTIFPTSLSASTQPRALLMLLPSAAQQFRLEGLISLSTPSVAPLKPAEAAAIF
jgi:hypothetical protein